MVTREILEKAVKHANICGGKIGSEHWLDEFLERNYLFDNTEWSVYDE